MSDPNQVYDNPLIGRYASREMAERWGPRRKFGTWRRLWLWLAEAQHALGLLSDDGKSPRISTSQLEAMRAHLDDIDFRKADEYERKFRHDVMAHVHTFGDAAPAARDIIHLGATSCYVTDNTDLILMRESLRDLGGKLASVIDALGTLATKWRAEPTLGFTHFQPAQLTTVGKRACLWAYDLVMDLHELERRRDGLKFRGAKGTTGTQASFLALFRGDHDKVKRLDRLVALEVGFDDVYPVTGQTYSRKVDSFVLDALAGLGQSLHKWGTDLRLLAHRQEIDEPFEADQVGSSAMAYKRNPMRAERLCGLSRFLMNLPAMAADTAATQWFERTLDDSAPRRLYLPQAFLAADACLKLALNLAGGLTVNRAVIRRGVEEQLPFIATENLIMAAVAKGGDRQKAHEAIRKHSHAVTAGIKEGSTTSRELTDRLKNDPMFSGIDFGRELDPARYVGRSPEQVDEFIELEVHPVRQRYAAHLGQMGNVTV